MPVQTLPTGRLVYGHPSKLIQKTDTKRQPVIKDGHPVMVRQFGVAYAKDVFNAEVWPVMYAAASSVFGGQQPPPHFSYKFKDGDGVDRQGRPYNQREGYAGHVVVHFETQFDLLAYRPSPQTGGWDQITEHDYKTGDWIRVSASIEGNKPTDPTHTPGLFINPQGVLLMYNGAAIVNAPSADQMFAGMTGGAMPPGATALGTAPPAPTNAPNPPGFVGAMPPGALAPVAAPPVAPQPVYAAPPVAAVPGAPVYPPVPGFVQQSAGVPPVPGQPVPLPQGS